MFRPALVLPLLAGLLFADRTVVGNNGGLSIRTSLTYGIGGPDRTPEIIAGETVFVEIVVSGLQTDGRDNVSLNTQVELLTADGKLVQTVPTADSNVPLPLGGTSMTHFSNVLIPRETAPGKYLIRIGVRDRNAQALKTTDVPIVVLDRSTFGALNLRLTKDQAAQHSAGCIFFTGDSPYVHFVVGGFKVQEGKVRLRATIRAVDKNKRPVSLASGKFEPERTGVLPDSDEAMPLFFTLNLNRPGSYMIHLQLEDLISTKRVEYYLPVAVGDWPADLQLHDTASKDPASLTR